jgi:hypothetical protein
MILAREIYEKEVLKQLNEKKNKKEEKKIVFSL